MAAGAKHAFLGRPRSKRRERPGAASDRGGARRWNPWTRRAPRARRPWRTLGRRSRSRGRDRCSAGAHATDYPRVSRRTPSLLLFPMRRPRARGRRFPARLRQPTPIPRLTDPLSHVIAQRHARRRRGARRAGAPRRARRAVATAPPFGRPEPRRSLGPDLDAVAPEEWTREGDAQHHRGWLVLVSASAAPVPPEKPERGERAFATLANGVLRLARDRKSLDITAVNLEGCEVRLCGVPGAAADEPEHSWPANVRWRPKKDGAGKEKRWWKRLPIVAPTQNAAVQGAFGSMVLRVSDAAKEVWTVALHRDVHRSRAMVDRAMFFRRRRRRAGEKGCPPPPGRGTGRRDRGALDHLASMRLARESRDASRARDDAAHGSKATAETGWASGAPPPPR